MLAGRPVDAGGEASDAGGEARGCWREASDAGGEACGCSQEALWMLAGRQVVLAGGK